MVVDLQNVLNHSATLCKLDPGTTVLPEMKKLLKEKSQPDKLNLPEMDFCA